MVLLVIWLGLLAGFCVAFWSRQRDQLARIGEILGDIGPLWLMAALAVVPSSLALTVEIYHTLLRRLGAPVHRSDVWRAHLRALAVGMAGPLGGPSSIAVFVQSLASRGVPPGDGMLAMLLSSVTGYGSFVLLLLPLLALLYLEGLLPAATLIATAGLIIVFALLVLLLWLVLRGPAPAPWLRRRLPGRLHPYAEHARSHNLRPRDFLRPWLLAVAVDATDAATLALSLAAIGQRPTLTATLVGTEVGTLFTVVSPVFQGLGAVELSLTVVLERFGAPAVVALSAALLYRACSLWLPLLAGLLAVGWQALAWSARRVLHRAVATPGNQPPTNG